MNSLHSFRVRHQPLGNSMTADPPSHFPFQAEAVLRTGNRNRDCLENLRPKIIKVLLRQ